MQGPARNCSQRKWDWFVPIWYEDTKLLAGVRLPYGNFWRRCSSGQKRDAFGNSSVISLLVGWVVERNGPPVTGSSSWWRGTEEAV